VTVGMAFQQAELGLDSVSGSPEALDFVTRNGNSRVRCDQTAFAAQLESQQLPVTDCRTDSRAFRVSTSKFQTYELNLGYLYDSRNRAIFADRGMRQRFNLGYTLPGSEIEFWTASYDYLGFLPLFKGFTLLFNFEAAYGKSLGDTTALPPYRQFFAGGPDSVRGYRETRLGPKDFFGRPYGGNIKTVAQTEILLPIPSKFRNSARFSLFFDVGNVFSDQDIRFLSPAETAPLGADGFPAHAPRSTMASSSAS